MKSKKGIGLIMGNVIFILVNLLFFSSLFYFGWRVANSDSVLEKTYAKQIALVSDQAKGNTRVELDISELLNRAEKNKFDGKVVEVDNDNNLIKVRVRNNGGYSISYFSDIYIGGAIDKQNKLFIFEVKDD